MPVPQIQLIEASSDELVAALAKLLPLVSSRATPLTAERLNLVLQNPATRVFVARLDGDIVGMALLLILTTLTGRSGYVEEVAVDESARGHGVATMLMRGLLEHAADLELDFVNLTSRPSRVAANQLYRSVGFKVRETNCYRYDLRPAPSTLVSS